MTPDITIAQIPFSNALILKYEQDAGLDPLADVAAATSLTGDGNSTTEIPFRHKFDGFNVNVPYMALFLVPYMKYDADEDSPGDEIFPGNIVTELIIKNNEVSRASYLFYKVPTVASPQKVLWTGPVHKSSIPQYMGKWVTGVDDNASYLAPLTRKRVYNTKISDNRRMSQIERLSVDFGGVSQIKNLSAAAKARLDVMKRVRENSYNYLSEVMYSKTDNNNLNITFGVNYGAILNRNALYAPLYAVYSELLSSCTMLSIRLLRRRVKKPDLYNKLTGGDIPNRVMDDNMETPIGHPQQINVNTNNGVLHYTITDSGMDDITTGIYEYGVEIQVLDGSVQKLNTLLSDSTMGLLAGSTKIRTLYFKGEH